VLQRNLRSQQTPRPAIVDAVGFATRSSQGKATMYSPEDQRTALLSGDKALATLRIGWEPEILEIDEDSTIESMGLWSERLVASPGVGEDKRRRTKRVG